MSTDRSGKYKLVAQSLGVCVVSFWMVAGIGEGASQSQDSKSPGRIVPKVAIDLERKTKGVAKRQVAAPEKPLESFEDLKDPFEDEVKNLPELKDPFERYNRSMYKFNDTLAEYVLSPMARGYSRVVPEAGRVAVKNVLTNAASPTSFLSSLVQGEFATSATVLGRLVINTALGVGGIFDVASYYGINPVTKDFDQALESYGVPTGPYIVLPVFGPSTVRHTVGRVADSLANPTTYFAPVAANLGAGAGGTVNTYSFNPDIKKDLDQSAIDPYESVRYFYYQRRGMHAEE